MCVCVCVCVCVTGMRGGWLRGEVVRRPIEGCWGDHGGEMVGSAWGHRGSLAAVSSYGEGSLAGACGWEEN